MVHFSFPSPVVGGRGRAMGSREGSELTAATFSKDALCVSGRQPCPCPPACVQLAWGLLS